jgi:hypothetical protein
MTLAPAEGDDMIETQTGYRPIDGTVVGIVESVTPGEVYWRHKKMLFVIPMERFTEYFTRA